MALPVGLPRPQPRGAWKVGLVYGGLLTLVVLGLGLLTLWLSQVYTLLSPAEVKQFATGWWAVLGLLGLLSFAVIVVALLDARHRERHQASAVVAAFVSSAPLLPCIAAISAVALYLARLEPMPVWNRQINDLAVLLGILAALGVWPLLAVLFQRFASADRANPRAYGELSERLDQLNVRLEILRGQLNEPDILYQQACRHRDVIAQELGLAAGGGRPAAGLPWVLGTGYINLVSRLHRAEEALLQIEPRALVISSAWHDEWCLRNSTLDNRDKLLDQLICARNILSVGPCGVTQRSECAPICAAAPDPKPLSSEELAAREREARAVLRAVRYSLNDFRDTRRDALVRARNRLNKTGAFTGLAAFVFLSLAIMLDVGPSTIVAITAFYLVGAIVGLFNRLRTAADSEEAVEDYGLTGTRLIHTPLFSGLAAIGGVALAALLPVAFDTVAFVPASVDAAQSASTIAQSLRLDQVFNLQTYPFGLVVAAIFGLTPSLLVDRLNRQTDRFKDDLRRSEPTESTTASSLLAATR